MRNRFQPSILLGSVVLLVACHASHPRAVAPLLSNTTHGPPAAKPHAPGRGSDVDLGPMPLSESVQDGPGPCDVLPRELPPNPYGLGEVVRTGRQRCELPRGTPLGRSGVIIIEPFRAYGRISQRGL